MHRSLRTVVKQMNTLSFPSQSCQQKTTCFTQTRAQAEEGELTSQYSLFTRSGFGIFQSSQHGAGCAPAVHVLQKTMAEFTDEGQDKEQEEVLRADSKVCAMLMDTNKCPSSLEAYMLGEVYSSEATGESSE